MSGNKKKKHESFSHEAIVRALFENYESIYAVDAETSSFRCFHERDECSTLKLEESGEDFFKLKVKNIEAVYLEDRDFINRLVSKDGLLAALSRDKFFSVVYRLVVEDKPLYHKLRATMGTVDGRPHFLIGIRNIDDDFRQDKTLAEQLSFMHRKENNHLGAMPVGAEGYIEANLTEEQRKEKEIQDMENELQRIRIRNFTSQMQPHFLYNALGAIQEIIPDDPVLASELIGDFMVHLRSSIRAMEDDVPIPFEQELANIKAYVNIEKIRFGDKLRINYDIQTSDFSILPLSVQPVVENAIRHGIYERGVRGGTVTIKTSESEDHVFVVVEDNGVGFDIKSVQTEIFSGKRDSTGLKNIMFRLDKIMRASIDIKSRIGIGTTVTITIPKEKRENESHYS